MRLPAVLALLVGLWPGVVQAITLRGSTTCLPVVQRVLEAYAERHPGAEVQIAIAGGGSGTGIKALLDGTVEAAMSSRPMKPRERRLARERGLHVEEFPFALDAIAVIVHPSNPLEDLSLEQLRALFAGRITNWKALGGPDRPVVVVSRETSSGTFECFQRRVMGRTRITPRALLSPANATVLQVVSQTPGAIGYVGLGYLRPAVKALRLNGVPPGERTVRSGAYPLVRPLYIYTRGEPRGVLRDFLEFLLGPEGQRVVRQQGFIPLRPPSR